MSDISDWGAGGSEGFIRDPGNEQTIPLAASATFTGQWKRIDNAESFLLLYGTHVPFTMQIQWSKDGVTRDLDPFATITPQVRQALGLYSVISPQSTFFRPFYRMVIINGASPQLFVVSDAILLKTVFPGYDISVDGPIPVLGLAKLMAGLNWGKMPVGSSSSWEPIQLTALKNQKVAIAENLVGNLPVNIQASFYHHRNTAGTVVLKTGTGILRSVIFNNGTVASTLHLYDGISAAGAVIANLNYTPAGSNANPSHVAFNVAFTTGLTLVQTGTHDFTITYE